jgi:hypothetical protein
MSSLPPIPVLTPQQQQTLSAREDRLKRTLRLAQLLAVAATGFIVTGAIKANNEDEHVRGDGYIFLFAGASSLMFSTLFCFNYYNQQQPNPSSSPTTNQEQPLRFWAVHVIDPSGQDFLGLPQGGQVLTLTNPTNNNNNGLGSREQ